MKHKGQNSSLANANHAQQLTGAQTVGLGEQTGFNGETAANAANRLKAPFNQVYYFDLNQYAVHQGDIASINAQANYLVAHPKARIRLEGNGDERGSREYNVALGWRRAQAVANILAQQGVAKNQIVMLSYGKEKPADFGHDAATYRLNRRVNLVYEVK